MSAMTFKRYDNAPPWGAWIFVAMALGVAFLAHRATATERIALWLVAGIFVTSGLAVLIRRYEQTTHVDAELRRVLIVERTRFSAQRRALAFDEVVGVEVESHTDPDPDARPFQTTTHRVVLALQNGERVAVTDFVLGEEGVRALRDQLSTSLRG